MLSKRLKIVLPLAFIVLAIFCWKNASHNSHNYVLIVGCNSLGSEKQTRYSSVNNDTQNLADFFVKHEGYAASHVVLINEMTALTPTRPEILRQLAWLKTQVQGEDQVLVFFIGHGFRYKGEDYFTPNKTDLASNATVLETAIPVKLISAYAGQMKAKEVVTFFEMCRMSHNHTSEQEMAFAAPTQIMAGAGSSSPSNHLRATVYSCLADQVSQTNLTITTGVFSSFLLQGLRGEAGHTKHHVTLSSLMTYLKPRVFASTRLLTGESQVPQVQINSGSVAQVSSIVLTKNEQATHDLETLVAAGRFSQLMFGAYKALLNDQPESGIEGFTAASKVDANSQLPWRELEAIFRTQFGNSKKTLQARRQIVDLALRTNNAKFKARLAQVSQQEGRFREAEQLYISSGIFSLREPANLVLFGFLKAGQGKAKQASSLYNKAIQINPRYSQAYLYLAPVVASEGKTKEAERLFLKAIELDPHNPIIFFNLAYFYDRQKDYQKAVSAMKSCVILSPRDSDYRAVLAEALWKVGKRREAHDEAKSALSLGSKSAAVKELAQGTAF